MYIQNKKGGKGILNTIFDCAFFLLQPKNVWFYIIINVLSSTLHGVVFGKIFQKRNCVNSSVWGHIKKLQTNRTRSLPWTSQERFEFLMPKIVEDGHNILLPLSNVRLQKC